MAEEAWTVQHRLLLSNVLEALPSGQWPSAGRVLKQFAVATGHADDSVNYTPKDCILQQERLFKENEDVLKRLLGQNESVSDLKHKPTTYAPVSAKLRKMRLKELRTTIRRRESEIRAIRREIEAVQNGQRDKTLRLARAAAMGMEVDEADKVEEDTGATNPQMKEKLLNLVNKVSQTKISKPFRQPVSAEDVPTYATIIKTPMDLATILAQVENDTITTRYQLVRAILLMCKNARTFNPPGTDIHNHALKLHDQTLEEADAIFGPPKANEKERTTRSRSKM